MYFFRNNRIQVSYLHLGLKLLWGKCVRNLLGWSRAFGNLLGCKFSLCQECCICKMSHTWFIVRIFRITWHINISVFGKYLKLGKRTKLQTCLVEGERLTLSDIWCRLMGHKIGQMRSRLWGECGLDLLFFCTHFTVLLWVTLINT